MKQSFARRFLVVAVILLALGVSCKMPTSSLGGINITIGQEVSSRNLLPELDMNPATYVVSGIGPSGSTFTPVTITSTSTSIERLVAGSWTITVDAYNADTTPTRIGTGKVTVLVSDGKVTETQIIVKPLPGNGTLTVNVTWPADVLVNPQIVATLKPTTGAVNTIAFEVHANSASFSSNSIPAGYYTLAISLNEGTTNVAGKSELVRIVEGQTTSGTYNFTNLNPAGGTANVTITPETTDPFLVSINGGQSTITVGASTELTAKVANYSGDLTYAWYVNGVDQGVSTANWTCGSDLKVGYYTIDVIVVNSSGSQAGSGTRSIEVDPNSYIGGWVFNASNIAIPGYWKNQKWNELPRISEKGAYVWSIVTYGNDVYAGGCCYNSASVPVAGYWKNGVWQSLSPDLSKGSSVTSLFIYNGSVIVAGYYNDGASACYWQDGAFHPLERPFSGDYTVMALGIAVENNDIYVCGYADKPNESGPVVSIPGYWKNGIWNALPSANPSLYSSQGFSISVSGSDVFVAGFDVVNGATIPGYWQNGIWHSIPTGPTTTYYPITSARFIGEDLYITGKATINGFDTARYWKNNNWYDLSENSYTYARCINSIDDSIYVGGMNGSQGGYWKNGLWVPLPSFGQAVINDIAFSQ